MDLFNLHADGVLRDLMQRQQGGITSKMTRGGKQTFDPLRQGSGFTLPQRGFGFPKSGGRSLSSGKFGKLPRSVREESEDMGEAKKQVVRNDAEDKKDEAVVVLGNVGAVDGSQESKQPVAADNKQPKEAKASGAPPPATPQAAGAAGAGGDAAGLAALVAQYQPVTTDQRRPYYLYEDLEGNVFHLGNVKKKAGEMLGYKTEYAFKKAMGDVGSVKQHTVVTLTSGGRLTTVHPSTYTRLARGGSVPRYVPPAPGGGTPAVKAEVAAMKSKSAKQKKKRKAKAGGGGGGASASLRARLEQLSPAQTKQMLAIVDADIASAKKAKKATAKRLDLG